MTGRRHVAEAVSFFDMSDALSAAQVAELSACSVREGDDSTVLISAIGPLEAAPDGSLTFFDNPKYKDALLATKAAVVICSSRNLEFVPDTVVALINDQPYKAFAKTMGALFPTAMRPQPLVAKGIASGAHIDPTVQLEDDVTVEHGAVIGPNASIGKGALIGPNAVVGPGVQIGRNSSISAGVTVINAIIGDDVILHCGVRIGCDGFGFAMGPGGHLKIPQIGRVVIQDKVEIGANTCVDRGSNRDTIIGEGTKIDNLVMIGHNVVIGRHCVIVGQTGIAGSSELGDYVVLGGQVAVNGHVKIGMGAQLAGLSGVSADVPPGVQWGGVPARSIKHWMRDIARLRREAAQLDRKKKENHDE